MNMNALFIKPLVALPIMLALAIVRVNLTIDLDTQSGFGAIEIQNIRSERMLIAKHQTIRPAFQAQPQP